jgi:hypothetical protein
MLQTIVIAVGRPAGRDDFQRVLVMSPAYGSHEHGLLIAGMPHAELVNHALGPLPPSA